MNLLLIYCFWLWIVSALFLLDIYPFSPLLGLIFALIFTTINNLANKHINDAHYTKKYGIIIWEAVILLIILSKTTKLDIVHNLVLFAIYLCYLFYNNTSFRDVYFNKLVEEHKKNPNQSFLDKVLTTLRNSRIL
tara:strand:- start:43 stop:447 length:405 start_codon:yes stop_codon:yes gene_type:complete